MTMNNAAPHLVVTKRGNWIDSYDHLKASRFEVPYYRRGFTYGPYIHTPQLGVGEKLISALPVNAQTKEYFVRYNYLYKTIQRNTDPRLLKYLPIRDRIALSLSRIHPLILRHLYSFHHKHVHTLPVTELSGVPVDQAIYLQIVCRFYGYNTYVPKTRNGICNVIIVRDTSINTNINLGNIQYNDEVVTTLKDFFSQHKHLLGRYINRFTDDQSIMVQSCSEDMQVERDVQKALDTKATYKHGLQKLLGMTTKALVDPVHVTLRKKQDKKPVSEGYTVYTPNMELPEPLPPYPCTPPHANRPVQLPAFASREMFLHLLTKNQILMVVGPTGSGKSTQYPQFVLDWMREIQDVEHCRILVTQPRRLAAITLAHRVSQEQGVDINKKHIRYTNNSYDETLGSNNLHNMPVGYSIHMESYGNDYTNIRFVTTGVLLRRIMTRRVRLDPEDISEQLELTPEQEEYWTSRSSIVVQRACEVLKDYSHIFIDEIHENNRNTEILLTILRDALVYLPHLRIILMSATANTATITNYMNIKSVIELDSRTYPVDTLYSKDIARLLAPSTSITKKESFTDRYNRMVQYLAIEYTKRHTLDVQNSYVKKRILEELQENTSVLSYSERLTPLSPPMELDKEVLRLIKFIRANSVTEEELEAANSRFSLNLCEAGNHHDKDGSTQSNNSLVVTPEASTFPTTSDINQIISSYFNDSNSNNNNNKNNHTLSEEVVQYAKDLLASIGITDTTDVTSLQVTTQKPCITAERGIASEPLPKGAILVFLPSWERIASLTAAILNDSELSDPTKYAVYQLHSTLSNDVQLRIFDKVQPNVTKIILGTNVAETSITIPDVAHVIDLGLAKAKIYDSVTDSYDFHVEIAAKSNANQRKGRVGRTKPGICYRLYSEDMYDAMVPSPRPEMLAHPVDDTVLLVKLLCHTPTALSASRKHGMQEVIHFMRRCMNSVNEYGIVQAIERLKNADILDTYGNLTTLGFYASLLPLDIYAARALITSLVHGCLDIGLTTAVYLNAPEFTVPMKGKTQQVLDNNARLRSLNHKGQSDLVTAINAFNAWSTSSDRVQFARDHCLNNQNLESWARLRIELFLTLKRSPLGSLIGPLGITKGGRLVYNPAEEQACNDKYTKQELLGYIDRIYNGVAAATNTNTTSNDTNGIGNMDYDDTSSSASTNTTNTTNTTNMIHNSSMQLEDVPHDMELVTQETIHLNDFPVDTTEWLLMLQSRSYEKSLQKNSANSTDTITTIDSVANGAGTNPLATLSSLADILLPSNTTNTDTQTKNTIFDNNALSSIMDPHTIKLYQDHKIGRLLNTSPGIPDASILINTPRDVTIPYLHANWASTIPWIAESVIHSMLYPRVALTNIAAKRDNLFVNARLPPPNPTKATIANGSMLASRDHQLQSPFIGYIGTYYNERNGFVLRGTSPIPSYALTVHKQTPTGQIVENTLNTIADTQSVRYSNARYTALQELVQAKQASSTVEHQRGKDIYNLQDVYVTYGYDELIHKELDPKYRIEIGTNRRIVSDSSGHTYHTKAHTYGMTKPHMIQDTLHEILWDITYTSDKERVQHVKKYGFTKSSDPEQNIDINTYSITGMVGVYEDLPTTQSVTAFIYKILKSYSLILPQDEDYTESFPMYKPTSAITWVSTGKKSKQEDDFLMRYDLKPLTLLANNAIFSPQAKFFIDNYYAYTRNQDSNLTKSATVHELTCNIVDILQNTKNLPTVHAELLLPNSYTHDNAVNYNLTQNYQDPNKTILSSMLEFLQYKYSTCPGFHQLIGKNDIDITSVPETYQEDYKQYHRSLFANTFMSTHAKALNATTPSSSSSLASSLSKHNSSINNILSVETLASYLVNEKHNLMKILPHIYTSSTNASNNIYVQTDALHHTNTLSNIYDSKTHAYIDVIAKQAQINSTFLSCLWETYMGTFHSTSASYYDFILFSLLNNYPVYHTRYGHDIDLTKRVYMLDSWMGITSDTETVQILQTLRTSITSLSAYILAHPNIATEARVLLHSIHRILSAIHPLVGDEAPLLRGYIEKPDLYIKQTSQHDNDTVVPNITLEDPQLTQIQHDLDDIMKKLFHVPKSKQTQKVTFTNYTK